MGWFSGKKKTYVSSVVYPLGEDGKDRRDMLQYTVLNSILQNRGTAESIRDGYLKGQGMALRNAFRYARDHYTDGLPTSAARYSDQPDVTVLEGVLSTLNKGAGILLVTTVVGSADYEWWAERYLSDTYGYNVKLARFETPPKGVDADANVAYDLEPDGSVQILLMSAGGKTTVLRYRPDGYVRMANYLHCLYRTERTFDGGVTTFTRPATPGEVTGTTYAASTVERTGETQVTTTKTAVVITGSQAAVTVSKTVLVTSRPKYFLYQLGTGKYPTLDASLATDALAPPYYPSIPLRVNNVDWTGNGHQDTELYKTSKKLLNKVGLDIADLGDKIRTNENVSEIDYCFAVFGVQLNTEAPEGKQYLFRFFQYLRSISNVTSADFNAWESDFQTKFPNGPDAANLPPGGVQPPPTNSVEIYSAKDRANNHDVKLQWQYIDTRLVSGTVSPNAKPGTVTVSMGGAEQLRDILGGMFLDSSVLLVRKQIDADTYEELAINGLVYENFIYAGKSVIVTAYDAMTDPDEEGFLVPLNQEILRETPLVELTNLSYQCMFLVFNCYKVVKQKWYQTGLFKIILIIVAVILCIFFPPAGVTALATVLTAAGVAAALVLVLAATIYVLGMMILSMIIMKVSTKIFGDKWGAVIGAIVSIMAMNYANTGSVVGATAGQSSNLLTAQNIMQATSALAQAYTQMKLAGISQDLQKLTDDYNDGMAKIEDLTEANLDTSMDMIDITGFTQATWENHFEKADTFLARTLLTGSDICEITTGMVEDFADIGLRLPTHG
jgi:hypothetical protein